MLTIEGNYIVELDHFSSLEIACRVPPPPHVNEIMKFILTLPIGVGLKSICND